MKCTEVCAQLPAFVYGDLRPEEAGQVEAHLQHCPACRQERAALEMVRQTLGYVPAPPLAVDLSRLYRRAAEDQRRRSGVWKRIAVAAVGAAAAVVVLLAGWRVEVRVDAQQLILRWGDGQPASRAGHARPDPQRFAPSLPDPAPAAALVSAEQVGLLNQLIQALAADGEARDRQHQEEVAQLQRQFRDLQALLARRLSAAERDVSALYAAQFVLAKKGATP